MFNRSTRRASTRLGFYSALVVLVGVMSTSVAHAGSIDLDTRRVATGLSRAVYCCHAPDDFSRLFIVRQSGQVRILNLDDLTVNSTPFHTQSVTGGTSGGDERGLLGMAFDPDYDTNGYFYLYYYSGSNTLVRRYTVSATNPDVSNPSSGLTIMSISQPQANHNGGQIEFSPIDGYLYIGVGDGGNFDDTGPGHAAGGNGQSGATRLGKILRIDVSNSVAGDPFDIPADNPFVGDPTHLDEIWAKGMRNPYRFGFDRLTGDLWIGDVGQNAEEEIDFEPAGMGGRNYGWRCMEGDNCYLSGCVCGSPSLTLPVHVYSHGVGCSVTGGRIYRGDSMPSMQGTYFFADYCSNRIWSGEINGAGTDLVAFTQRLPGELAPPPGQGSIASISGFGEDAYGDVYICDLGGEVFKIVPDDIASQDCNDNYIVDAIEVGFIAGTDCNMNGIDDTCEILTGVAADCNSNGIPDDCDLVSGVLTDANGDGFADECGYYVLQALDGAGAPGGSVAHTTVGSLPDDLGAYSIALEFDPSVLSVTSLTLDGLPGEDADFFAPNFDNVAGTVTAGVAFDIVPPIDSSIPGGLSVPLLITNFDVNASASIGDTTSVCPVPIAGAPAVTSVFSSPGGTSTTPELVCGSIEMIAGALFVRGDANDDGGFDIADPVYVLSFLFSSGPDLNCEDSGDTNDDGALDIADPVFSLSALFTMGASPSSPFPGCGIDPTDDTATCDVFNNCP